MERCPVRLRLDHDLHDQSDNSYLVYEPSHQNNIHPGFELGITPAQESRLAADFGLGIVAFDELELDEFLHIWTEPYYKLIESQQEVHSYC